MYEHSEKYKLEFMLECSSFEFSGTLYVIPIELMECAAIITFKKIWGVFN